MQERNNKPCFIKLIAKEKGIACNKKDCPRIIDASECRPLQIERVFPPSTESTTYNESASMPSPTILDLIEKAIPDHHTKKPVEVEDAKEFMEMIGTSS